jgi:hypothetical protein
VGPSFLYSAHLCIQHPACAARDGEPAEVDAGTGLKQTTRARPECINPRGGYQQEDSWWWRVAELRRPASAVRPTAVAEAKPVPQVAAHVTPASAADGHDKRELADTSQSR